MRSARIPLSTCELCDARGMYNFFAVVQTGIGTEPQNHLQHVCAHLLLTVLFSNVRISEENKKKGKKEEKKGVGKHSFFKDKTKNAEGLELTPRGLQN